MSLVVVAVLQDFAGLVEFTEGVFPRQADGEGPERLQRARCVGSEFVGVLDVVAEVRETLQAGRDLRGVGILERTNELEDDAQAIFRIFCRGEKGRLSAYSACDLRDALLVEGKLLEGVGIRVVGKKRLVLQD